MIKNAKNFAIWTAINSEKCVFFSERFSYYGGVNMTEKQQKQYVDFCERYSIEVDRSYRYSEYTNETILKQIMSIGIDWDRSCEPSSNTHNCFNGTFADSTLVDTVVGELVLLDGQRIEFVAECTVDTAMFESIAKFFEES
jgi:hypothetical protein